MAEGSNWRVDKIMQRVISDPGGPDVTVSETQIVNDRGATLFRTGVGPVCEEIFVYEDGDISTRIFALRFDGTERRNMTDTYRVVLAQPYRTVGPRVPQTTIDRIKQDLEEALRVYPPLKVWPGTSQSPPTIPDIIHVTFH